MSSSRRFGTSSGSALSIEKQRNLVGCAGCLGTLLGGLFFTAFLMAGLVMSWFIVIEPVGRILAARSWQAVPCKITHSEVEGDETYSIEIHYDYEVQGQQYTGHTYSFFTMKTGGRKSKEKIVQQYPVGSEATCYVNPDRPSESVINRDVDSTIWWGLFPLPFLLIGLGGYYGIFIARRKVYEQQFSEGALSTAAMTATGGSARTVKSVPVSNSDFDDEDLLEEPGPVTLKPETSPLGSFLVILIFTIIWNGVVSAFFLSRWDDWMKGEWQWVPEIVLLPFAVVGLVMIAAAIHSFLSLFNPVPILTLSRRLIPLGGTARLSWQFSGSTRSIRQLQVTLKGVEEVRYTRGTNTSLETESFHDELLCEIIDPTTIEEGELEIRIPTDSMHSFSAPNNKIKWHVYFRGDIPFWPDISQEFSIQVVPHE